MAGREKTHAEYLPEAEARRLATPREVIRELSRIPGVGPSLARDLYLLGVEKVSELKKRSPERMYEELNRRTGVQMDRCVLYVFRCAVHYAKDGGVDPEKLKWWNWKDPVT